MRTREREYVRRESPERSYRYVEPRGEPRGDRRSSLAISIEEGGGRRERDYGGRSGSVTYAVNPRASTASHRSARERIVVSDYDGRRREYYK